VWSEIWRDTSPMLDTALSGDQGTYVEAQLLIMERYGYPEETYYTFSYSPIPNDDGRVGGILCVNTDDTQRVIGERQFALLRDLAADTTHARSWGEACGRSAEVLRRSARDLPFAMVYMTEQDGLAMKLAGVANIDRGYPAAPEHIAIDSPGLWPVGEVVRRRPRRWLRAYGSLPGSNFRPGPWPESASQAAVFPIFPTGEMGRAGVLVWASTRIVGLTIITGAF
jgi:hypothetical protein